MGKLSITDLHVRDVEKFLGKISDGDVAEAIGLSLHSIRNRRIQWNIPVAKPAGSGYSHGLWSPILRKVLMECFTDEELVEYFHLSEAGVKLQREFYNEVVTNPRFEPLQKFGTEEVELERIDKQQ